MKTLSLTAMLLCMLGTATAQTTPPKWDSTHRPNGYQSRVELFRSLPNDEDDIIMLGNSITHYAEWNELMDEDDIRNRGISGDITFGVLERLDEVTEGKPSKVFILIGTNDIARNIPDSVILRNYRRMIQRIKAESPKTKIYFQTILPVNNDFPARNHFNKDEHIAAVNEGLKKIAAEEKINLIDLHPHFLDASKKLDKRYTYDGLHLSGEGYKLWAKILKEQVD